MYLQKCLSVVFCFILIGSAVAQSVTKNEKKYEVSDELRAKSNALLVALARETEQFYLPENRITARYLVAGLLWESDEKQSRQLFESAVSDVSTLITSILVDEATDDEMYFRIYEVGEIRKALLRSIAGRDAVFAFSSFQSLGAKKSTGEDLFEGDDMFELELADIVAKNDPKKAYEVTLKNLESGFPYGIVTSMENIYKKDPELGAKIATAILEKIKDQRSINFSANNGNSNSNIAVNAKPSGTPTGGSLPEEINVYQIKEFVESVRALNRNAFKEKKTPVMAEPAYKELIGLIARKYSTGTYLSAYDVGSIIKEIDLHAPAFAQSIRRRLSAEKENLDAAARDSDFMVEVDGKSTKEIIEFINKKPVAQRDEFYSKAAETAFNAGDVVGANELYSKVETKPEYDYLTEMINAGLPRALAEGGNAEEVRELLNSVKTPEEKIAVLTTLSQSLAAAGNFKVAKELAEEARATYSGKVKTKRNMASVVQLSGAYAALDANQGFSFLESNLSFVNDIIAAGVVVDEFNEGGAVKENEILLGTVLFESYQNMPKGVALLRNLAKADFERTVAVADRFSRREAKFFARLRIVQALLDPNAEAIETENQKTYEGEGC